MFFVFNIMFYDKIVEKNREFAQIGTRPKSGRWFHCERFVHRDIKPPSQNATPSRFVTPSFEDDTLFQGFIQNKKGCREMRHPHVPKWYF